MEISNKTENFYGVRRRKKYDSPTKIVTKITPNALNRVRPLNSMLELTQYDYAEYLLT